jgi:creatinine amidohydrolase
MPGDPNSRGTRPRRLDELTWTEVAEQAGAQPIVLVPIGATEAHGPHLPLGTDVFLSEELAARAQRALDERGRPSLIAPSLAYSVTEFGAPFSGTVSLEPAAASALLVGVCCGLVRTGLARICLVNSHLEAAHVAVLRAAVAEVKARCGATVAFPDHTERRWARTLSDEYKKGNCHAGRYETALLLGARPELVRREVASGLAPNPSDFLAAVRGGAGTFVQAGGPEAYFGDPARATLSEGEELFGRLVGMVVTTVEETWPGLQRKEPDGSSL